MQKFSTLLLALIACAGTIFASNTKVNGIWYDFNNSSQTASVTYRGSTSGAYSNEYTGDVNIPESVDYNSVTYSVTSIGEGAFSNCYGLTSITIPNSVTSIGHSAFYFCTVLTSITIPNSVTSIVNSAFGECSGLTSIVVASGNTTYDSRENCNAIIETSTNTLIAGCKNTIIPNSVTSIGDWAFGQCTGLTSIEIPNSVTSIGGGAFYGCGGLTSITIPNSVTSIGVGAFCDCSGLTSVTNYATIPQTITSNVFLGVKSSCTLYVPKGSIDLYKAADVWKVFTNIQAIDETQSIGEITNHQSPIRLSKIIKFTSSPATKRTPSPVSNSNKPNISLST